MGPVFPLFCCLTAIVSALFTEPAAGDSDKSPITTSTDPNEEKNELKELWRGLNIKMDMNRSAFDNDRKKRSEELDRVVMAFEPRIKEVNSYVTKPQHWMLEFFDQINAALINRKYKYMRAKREEIQEVMNEAYGFIALTALTSPGHLDEGEVCTEKGLSAVISGFIRKIHQTPLEVIKIVKLLRVRLLKYFYKAGTWDEQIAADLYTFFKLMIGTKNQFDEMAAEVESKWEEMFEKTRKQVIRLCQVEVSEVEERIHDAIGDSWEKLNSTEDPELDEDKLLEGLLGPSGRRGPETDEKEDAYFSSSPRPRKILEEMPVRRKTDEHHPKDDVPPGWHIRLFDKIFP